MLENVSSLNTSFFMDQKNKIKSMASLSFAEEAEREKKTYKDFFFSLIL